MTVIGSVAVLSAALLASCATQPAQVTDAQRAAANRLAAARDDRKPTGERAALYLQAAAAAESALGTGTAPTADRQTYNEAATELTLLLRSADNGRWWNHPDTFPSGNETYHLRFQPADRDTWAPDYFTSLESASEIKHKLIKTDNVQEGAGGALVGVRRVTPRDHFAPLKGISAPVTATLDFKGHDATLALRQPAKAPAASIEGKTRPLAADFSAPISYYAPPANLMLVGLMGTFRSSHYIDKTGLYFLQPYDPDRIPIVFVHGLASTPFTWVHTINELQTDPEIRKRYQFWIFAYPTGVPILYSALRLRKELSRVDQLYPNHRPLVVVGHSMGGILTHAQVCNLTRAMWERDLGDMAKDVFARNPSNSLIIQSVVFKANPRISRVVFICTPHRGSEMASGGIGKLGISLISMPLKVAVNLKDALTQAELAQITGSAKVLPNSVNGLKPTNPAFKVINSASITVPYHSIIGNRGKPGPLADSSDGVVPYWSSHLDKAQSEVIVPGPHGSCALPQTIVELKRILALHLHTSQETTTRSASRQVPARDPQGVSM